MKVNMWLIVDEELGGEEYLDSSEVLRDFNVKLKKSGEYDERMLNELVEVEGKKEDIDRFVKEYYLEECFDD